MKFLLLILFTLLMGCSSEGYIRDVAGAPQDVAVLEGTVAKRKFPYDNQQTYVKTIDGLKPGWAWHDEPAKGPFKLASGRHSIEIEHRQGFMAASYTFNLNLKAEITYAAISLAEDKGEFATIWIQEEQSGKVVTEKMEVRRQHNGGSIIIVI